MLFRLLTHADLPQTGAMLGPGFRCNATVRESLLDVWSEWLANGCMHGGVVEDPMLPAADRLQFSGMSVFLRDELAEQLRQHPHAQAASEIYQRALNGESPILTHREVAARNRAGRGLHLMAVHCVMRNPDVTDPNQQLTVQAGKDLFDWLFVGYQLQSISFQIYGTSQRDYLQQSGLHLLAQDTEGLEPVEYPCFLSAARGDATFGSTVSYYFLNRLPRFGFSAAEQAVLLRAIFNESDEDIAANLGIALDTVRKHWRAMFNRVEQVDAVFFPRADNSDQGKRGPEKRRVLLHYVRQRLEEIRPHVR